MRHSLGSKRTLQIKLRNGLTTSRVQTTFAVHASLIVHVPTRPNFHVDEWAAGPSETQNRVVSAKAISRQICMPELRTASTFRRCLTPEFSNASSNARR